MGAGKSVVKDEKFACGKCNDTNNSLRILPSCDHSFCEQCLLDHASDTQQQQGKFNCPVCGKEHSPPGENTVTLEWIQTLPLVTAISTPEDSTSQTNEGKQVRRDCDPCREQGETVSGVKCCMDCREVLCEACANCHKNFKATKSHNLVDTGLIPAEAFERDFLSDFTHCEVHTEREAEFYCKSHDIIACAACLTSGHKHCDVSEIVNRATDAATLTEESEKLLTQMKAQVDHLNRLEKQRIERKTTFNAKLLGIRENVQHIRNQAVHLLDDIVDHVLNATKEIETEKSDEADIGISSIVKIRDEIETNVTLLDTIEQHGSEKQKFATVHFIKKQSEETRNRISEEDQPLPDLDVAMVVAEDIRKLAIGYIDVTRLVDIKLMETEGKQTHTGTTETLSNDTGSESIPEGDQVAGSTPLRKNRRQRLTSAGRRRRQEFY